MRSFSTSSRTGPDGCRRSVSTARSRDCATFASTSATGRSPCSTARSILSRPSARTPRPHSRATRVVARSANCAPRRDASASHSSTSFFDFSSFRASSSGSIPQGVQCRDDRRRHAHDACPLGRTPPMLTPSDADGQPLDALRRRFRAPGRPPAQRTRSPSAHGMVPPQVRPAQSRRRTMAPQPRRNRGGLHAAYAPRPSGDHFRSARPSRRRDAKAGC